MSTFEVHVTCLCNADESCAACGGDGEWLTECQADEFTLPDDIVEALYKAGAISASETAYRSLTVEDLFSLVLSGELALPSRLNPPTHQMELPT